MPRTRSHRAREDKRDEIVAAARRRLDADGYGGMSVVGLAQALGVAQNSIYWYFPSKDHLFVAALEQMIAEIAATTPGTETTTEDRVLWFVDRLEPVWRHSDVVQQRRPQSAVIEEFAARLDATVATMLANALRDAVADAELALAADAFRTLVEGAYARRLPLSERHRLLRYALRRIVGHRARPPA